MAEDTNNEKKHLDFVQLMARHERAIRGFTRSLLPSGEAVDDIMQDVFVIAWKKFEQLDHHDNFPKWVCGIARYQVLNYRRSMARNRLVLNSEIINMVAEEGQEDTEESELRLKALEGCLEQLPQENQELVQRVYQQRNAIPKLARETGKKENAIYQKMWRIRRSLSKCVENKLLPAG